MLELSQTQETRKLGSSVLRILLTSVTVAALAGAAAWYLWPSYELWAARRAFQQGNLEKADDILRSYTRVYRSDGSAHLLYGEVLHRLEHYRDADIELGRALEAGVPKEKVRRAFGLLWATYMFDKARGALREELQAQPDDIEVLKALALGSAQAHLWEESEGYFNRWVEMEHDSSEAILERGQMYMDSADFAKAIADFRTILQRTPHNFRARLNLAHCVLADARPKEAEAELVVCRQLRPDSPEPLVDLAACALEKLDYEKANTLLTQALQLDMGNHQALNDLGNLQMIRKRYDLALATFRDAVRRYPRDKQAHLKLSQVLRFLNKPDEASIHEEIYRRLDAEEEQRTRPGTRRR
jgi:tetratricopeptide (TPR) repeat protein